jgi:hypothetical protein
VLLHLSLNLSNIFSFCLPPQNNFFFCVSHETGGKAVCFGLRSDGRCRSGIQSIHYPSPGVWRVATLTNGSMACRDREDLSCKGHSLSKQPTNQPTKDLVLQLGMKNRNSCVITDPATPHTSNLQHGLRLAECEGTRRWHQATACSPAHIPGRRKDADLELCFSVGVFC